MSFKLILSTLCFLSLSTILQAQLEKTIHQTFEVKNSQSISIQLIGDSTQIVPWAGNTILTETKVQLYDASPSIMAHFMEKELRYAIEADTTGQRIQLYSNDQERKPIRTKTGECFENVTIRVFIPENFEQSADFQYTKTN